MSSCRRNSRIKKCLAKPVSDPECSLPVYSVEEDKQGKLINRSKRLIWPSTKPMSKKEFDKNCDPRSVCSASTFSCDTDSENCTDDGSELEAFIGGATSSKAEKMLGNRSFVLYYRMPDDGKIPIKMPLMLVYRSTKNVYYHFTISERNQYDAAGNMVKKFFKVECGDNLEFLSLETLIRHYETFVYHDVWSGSMESFPVGTKEGAVFDVYK